MYWDMLSEQRMMNTAFALLTLLVAKLLFPNFQGNNAELCKVLASCRNNENSNVSLNKQVATYAWDMQNGRLLYNNHCCQLSNGL